MSLMERPVGQREQGPRTGLHGASAPSVGPQTRAVWPQRSGGQAAVVPDWIREPSQRVAKQFASPTTGASDSRCLLDHGASEVSPWSQLCSCRGRMARKVYKLIPEIESIWRCDLGEFLSHLLGCCPGRFPSSLENMRRRRLPQTCAISKRQVLIPLAFRQRSLSLRSRHRQ